MTAQASIPGEREHPALALVNSRHNSRAGMVDHLASPEALVEWLAWRSLLPRAGAPAAAGREASLPRAGAAAAAGGEASLPRDDEPSDRIAVPTAADLHAALALRDAVRELFSAAIEGRSPGPSAVATVNEVSAGAPAAEQLRWDAQHGPVRSRTSPAATELQRALAALAEDAIGLVSGERRDDLIACEAPGCVRLLLKDHPRRHWCSTRCGDRVRAARYYRRSRERSD